jgi:hypothetical protein
MTEMNDAAAQKRSQRGTLRRQKGWPGFVHGYSKRRKVFDKVWHTINWNKDPKKSGAKSVESDGKGKTIYTF